MNSVTCFQQSVVYEQILWMWISCDFGRAFIVCGGWFNLALKYWNVADGLEKGDLVREASFSVVTLASKKLTVNREYDYGNFMLDNMPLLLLYSLQYLRKDIREASSPIQTKNVTMNLNHMAGLCLHLCSWSCNKRCSNSDIIILAQLTAIGTHSHPFDLVGELTIEWHDITFQYISV